jgi:hypothetical protein
MLEISDEMLMAYADGELNTSDRNKVDAYLTRNPDGKHRLDVFVQTREKLSTLFNGPLYEPIPARLLQTIQAHSKAAPQIVHVQPHRAKPTWPNLSSLIQSITPQWPNLFPAGALAATLLVGVSIGTIWQKSRTMTNDGVALVTLNSGQILASGQLLKSLETTPSGTQVVLNTGSEQLTLKPIMTFARHDGGHCRQYELDTADGRRLAGLSCRTSTGAWQLEAHSPMGHVTSSNTQVAPAGTTTSPVIEATVDRLINGDVLGKDQEAALIAKRWQPKAP